MLVAQSALDHPDAEALDEWWRRRAEHCEHEVVLDFEFPFDPRTLGYRTVLPRCAWN